MKISAQNLVFVLLFIIFFSGCLAEALSYDYSASIECVADPPKPQYGGGIIVNPEFNNSLKGWLTFGYGEISERISGTGNKFSVARSRNKPYQSVSQKIYLHESKLYTFSAWLQISEGNAADVRVVFKTGLGFVHAGAVTAKSGCWSMLKGGLTVNVSGPAEFYFESKKSSVEIWVDSVSLQPFTKEEWRSHQAQTINKLRRGTVRITAVDASGNRIPGAAISIKPTRPGFPFGSAVPATILQYPAYQNWFTSRFTVTVFENEMKWYSTERQPGVEDYSVPDAMVAFFKQHNIAIRGHNVLWDDPKYQMGWVSSLSSDQLRQAADRRVNSVVGRYRGQLIAWDVVNENLHFSFFEDRLGAAASAEFFQRAHQSDPNTVMFMNDYNTLEQPGDPASTPQKYLQRLWGIWGYGRVNGQKMAIGLEGHFNKPNIPYMRATLDLLAKANLPIWLTEVDVAKDPNQAQYLEEILREGYAHPGVAGIMMWAGWHQEGCDRMCLTDNNFHNLPTGDVVDKLIGEWRRGGHVEGTADGDGVFEAAGLPHGEYEVTVGHHPLASSSPSSSVQRFNVAAGMLDFEIRV